MGAILTVKVMPMTIITFLILLPKREMISIIRKKVGIIRKMLMGILVLLFVVVAAPVLTSHDPYFYGPDSLAAPGVNGHLLGTNHMGQDVLSMLLYGVRTSVRDNHDDDYGDAHHQIHTHQRGIIPLGNGRQGQPAHPCVTLVIITMPGYFRITKSSILQVTNEDFITTMRATGMSEKKIFNKYIFRNAILPTEEGVYPRPVVPGAEDA